jgi:hypothetical protein
MLDMRKEGDGEGYAGISPDSMLGGKVEERFPWQKVAGLTTAFALSLSSCAPLASQTLENHRQSKTPSPDLGTTTKSDVSPLMESETVPVEKGQTLIIDVSDNSANSVSFSQSETDELEPLRVCLSPDERRSFEFTLDNGEQVEFEVQRRGYSEDIDVAGVNGEPEISLPISINRLGDLGDPCFEISPNE